MLVVAFITIGVGLSAYAGSVVAAGRARWPHDTSDNLFRIGDAALFLGLALLVIHALTSNGPW